MKKRVAGLLALMFIFLISCKDDDIDDLLKFPDVKLLTPANESNGVDIGPTFTWEASDPDGKSLTYDFYIGTDSSKLILEASNLTSPTYTLSDYSLKKDFTYYWYVAANNGTMRGESQIWNFMSIPAPDAPVLVGPVESEFIRDELTFSWEAVQAGEGEEIIYEVFFGSDKKSLEKVASVKETSFSYDASALEIGKVYYWQIKASDLINASASEMRSFKKLMTGAPDEPMIASPDAMSGLYETSVQLSWTAVPDPEGDAVIYDVYMDESLSPSTLVAEGISEVSFIVEPAEVNKPYYWRVVARDASSNYTESVVSSFLRLAAGAPGSPVLNDLAIDGTYSLDEVLMWDAVTEPDGQEVTYDIYVDAVNPPMNKVASDLTGTDFVIPNSALSCDLIDVKTFYCVVVAKDADGNESKSVPMIFQPQMEGIFTDVRGEEVEDYTWVRIGTQIWFSQGLRTRAFTNGNPIPNIGGVALTAGKEVNDAVKSECFWDEYDHHEVYPNNDWAEVYGRVYSYGCIYHEKFAPSGWHVADKEDTNILKSYVNKDVYGCTSTFHVDAGSGKAGTNTYGLNWQSAGWRYPTSFRTDGAFMNRALNWIDNSNASFLELRVYNGEWRYAQYNTKMMFGIRLVKNN